MSRYPISDMDAAIQARLAEDLARMGVVGAAAGWRASNLDKNELWYAREAVLAQPPGGVEQAQALVGLREPGHFADDVLKHALERAGRGRAHGLAWTRVILKVAPWALEVVGHEGDWLAALVREARVQRRVQGASWAFVWQGMQTRWTHTDLLERRAVSGSRADADELLGLAVVARMGGTRLTWPQSTLARIETRMAQQGELGAFTEHQEHINWLGAMVRRARLAEDIRGQERGLMEKSDTPRPNASPKARM